MQHMQIHPSLSLIRSCLPSVATAVEGRRAHVSQRGNNHKEILTSSVWHVPLTPARYTWGGKSTAQDNYWCPFCKMDDFCGANKHGGVAQNPPTLHLLHWPCQWQTNSGGCEYTRNTDLHPLLMVRAMLTVMVTGLSLTPASPFSLHTTAFSGSSPCFPQFSSFTLAPDGRRPVLAVVLVLCQVNPHHTSTRSSQHTEPCIETFS